MYLDHVQKYSGEGRKVACGGGGLLSQSSVTVCQIQSQSQFPIPLSHFLTRPPSSLTLRGQVPRGIESRPLMGIKFEGKHMELWTSQPLKACCKS
jgi:hypothetical protein